MPLDMQDSRNQDSHLNICAISCTRSEAGTHAAFIYERDNGAIWTADVAWNLIARNYEIHALDQSWVNINIPEQILEILVSILEIMGQNHNIIPYDVRYTNGEYFDPVTWSYCQEKPGLTCATFVLAVLRGLKLELFDVNAWPTRSEDGPALERLLSMLSASGVDAHKINAQRLGHNCIRYRPEEVTGSVSGSRWPVPFGLAADLGTQVLLHVMNRV